MRRVARQAAANRADGSQINSSSFARTLNPRVEKNASMPIGETAIGVTGKK
jgi:hypothetical protein